MTKAKQDDAVEQDNLEPQDNSGRAGFTGNSGNTGKSVIHDYDPADVPRPEEDVALDQNVDDPEKDHQPNKFTVDEE